MAITLTVGGIDYTTSMGVNSLTILDKLNSRNTASFKLIEKSDIAGGSLLGDDDGDTFVTDGGAFIGIGYRPDVGDAVQVKDGETVIFAGTIDGIDETRIASPHPAIVHTVECVDYNELADRRRVVEEFEAMTAGAIAEAIVTEYLGLTCSVEAGPTVARAIFNWQTVAQALDDLAELTGFAWNIDYDQTFHFFSRETNAAPYALTSDSGNHSGLTISRERSRYRNRQTVRAGVGVSDEQTESFTGDGTRATFTVGLPLAREPVVTLNAVAQTVGINGVDDATSFDWYWSQGSGSLTQRSGATVLTGADTLVVTYQGQIPLTVTVEDAAEVASRGIFEGFEDRPGLDDQDLASLTAGGLLRKLGRIPVTADWATRVAGLAAGQLIPITVPEHDLSGDWLIDQVRITDQDGKTLQYDVRALDGESLGGWVEFFKKMASTGRGFTIRENEVLLLLRDFSETVTAGSDDVAHTTAATGDSHWLLGTAALGYFEL